MTLLSSPDGAPYQEKRPNPRCCMPREVLSAYRSTNQMMTAGFSRGSQVILVVFAFCVEVHVSLSIRSPAAILPLAKILTLRLCD